METQKSERAARLAMLESAIRLAAANPGTDLSEAADQEQEQDYDPIRNIEPHGDVEPEAKKGLFLASW